MRAATLRFSGSWSVVRAMPRRDARPRDGLRRRRARSGSATGRRGAARPRRGLASASSAGAVGRSRRRGSSRVAARVRGRMAPVRRRRGRRRAARASRRHRDPPRIRGDSGGRWVTGGIDPSSVVSEASGLGARCPLGVEGVLQNDNGGNLVDDRTLASTRLPRRRAAPAGRDTVESRSSTRRTGTCRAAARRCAKASASVGRRRSRRPTATAAARRRARWRRTPRRARGCGARRRRRRPLACTVSTGVASRPSGSQRATPMRARPTSMPSRTPGRMRPTGRAPRRTASSAAGIADDVAAAALGEVVLAAAAAAEDARPASSRARPRSRPASRAAGVGRDDRRAGLPPTSRREGDDGCRVAEPFRARRSRASAARRPSRALPTCLGHERARRRRARAFAASAGTRSLSACASNCGDLLLRRLEVGDELARCARAAARAASSGSSVSSETIARSAARSRKASRPTSDSTRRLVAPTDDSLTRLIMPTSALVDTCVPAQSSRDHGPPMSTTRTVSPYFSPNSAIAPSAFASSSGMLARDHLRLSRIGVVRDLLDLAAGLGRERLSSSRSRGAGSRPC